MKEIMSITLEQEIIDLSSIRCELLYYITVHAFHSTVSNDHIRIAENFLPVRLVATIF